MLGKRAGPNGDEWCVASEDCAFGPIAFERVRDVNPGEMVIITEEGKLLTRQVHPVSAGAKICPVLRVHWNGVLQQKATSLQVEAEFD